MAMKVWAARIRMGSSIEEVTIQARHPTAAKNILEAQYGKGSIYSGPTEYRDGHDRSDTGIGWARAGSGSGFFSTAFGRNVTGVVLAVAILMVGKKLGWW